MKQSGKPAHAGAKGAAKGLQKRKGERKLSNRDKIKLLQHLLKKPPHEGGLDGGLRLGKQAELDKLIALRDSHKRQDREKKITSKYHKVRFFERVKIERSIARLERLLAGKGSLHDSHGAAAAAGRAAPGGGGGNLGRGQIGSRAGKCDSEGEGESGSEGEGERKQQPAPPQDRATLERELESCRQDLLYVRHFPPGMKYVSLLRQADTPQAQAELESKRAKLRGIVAQRLAQQASIADLDEGLGPNSTAAFAARAAAEAEAHAKAAQASKATAGGGATAAAGKAVRDKNEKQTHKPDGSAAAPTRQGAGRQGAGATQGVGVAAVNGVAGVQAKGKAGRGETAHAAAASSQGEESSNSESLEGSEGLDGSDKPEEDVETEGLGSGGLQEQQEQQQQSKQQHAGVFHGFLWEEQGGSGGEDEDDPFFLSMSEDDDAVAGGKVQRQGDSITGNHAHGSKGGLQGDGTDVSSSEDEESASEGELEGGREGKSWGIGSAQGPSKGSRSSRGRGAVDRGRGGGRGKRGVKEHGGGGSGMVHGRPSDDDAPGRGDSRQFSSRGGGRRGSSGRGGGRGGHDGHRGLGQHAKQGKSLKGNEGDGLERKQGKGPGSRQQKGAVAPAAPDLKAASPSPGPEGHKRKRKHRSRGGQRKAPKQD